MNANDLIDVVWDIKVSGLDNMTELNVVYANNLSEKIWQKRRKVEQFLAKMVKKSGYFVLKLGQFGVFVGVF